MKFKSVLFLSGLVHITFLVSGQVNNNSSENWLALNTTGNTSSGQVYPDTMSFPKPAKPIKRNPGVGLVNSRLDYQFFNPYQCFKVFGDTSNTCYGIGNTGDGIPRVYIKSDEFTASVKSFGLHAEFAPGQRAIIAHHSAGMGGGAGAEYSDDKSQMTAGMYTWSGETNDRHRAELFTQLYGKNYDQTRVEADDSSASLYAVTSDSSVFNGVYVCPFFTQMEFRKTQTGNQSDGRLFVIDEASGFRFMENGKSVMTVKGNGEVVLSNYSNSRNDAANNTPFNFLYTDANGKLRSASLLDLAGKIQATPLNHFEVKSESNVLLKTGNNLIDAPSNIASLTLQFPSKPIDGETVSIGFVNGVSTLTYTNAPENALSTAKAGEKITYLFSSKTAKWYRW